MKATKTLRVFLIVSLLALCLATVCFAAVSVNNPTSLVGPQVTLTATTDAANPTYQWYECEEDGTIIKSIDGATDKEYKPYVDVAGETYYKVVVNGTEEAVATVTGTMPTEPVVLRFNNAADLQYWTSADNKALTKYDGKDVFVHTLRSSGDGYSNFAASTVDDIYLQAYPYIVVSLHVDGATANSTDLYFNADRPESKKGGITFRAAGMDNTYFGDGFGKLLVDTKELKYYSYKPDGTVVSATGKSFAPPAGEAYLGRLVNGMRVDFINQAANAGKKCYIYYMGFFPTKQMALDYAGEMPYDDDAKDIFDAIEGISMPYGAASGKDAVEAYAEAQVNALTADVIEGIDAETVLTFKGGEYKPAADCRQTGTYTFTVALTIGDKPFRRTIVEKEFTMTLAAKPQTDVFLPDVSVTIGEPTTLTVEVKSGITATSYQWYSCDDAEGTNPQIMTGETNASYTVAASEETGVRYYKVVVNGDESLSCVAAVATEYPTEPVILKFNNAQALKCLGGSTFTLENISGTVAMKFTHKEGAKEDNITIGASYINDFYIQAYPYVVISASYPEHATNNLDMYMGTDAYSDSEKSYGFNTAYTGVTTTCGEGFHKTIIDTTDRDPSDGFNKAYKGKFTSLRFDFSNGVENGGKPVYVEYVGFFSSLEDAKAYAGEMPDDSAAQPIIDAIEAAEAEGDLSIAFCDAENETAAAAAALEMINAMTTEAVEELKADYSIVDFRIANAKYTRASPTGKGTYTLDAQVLVGNEPFKCSLVSTSVTMDLLEKPAPVVMKFDSQAQVDAAAPAAVEGTLTKSFVTEGDRGFMRIVASGKDKGEAQVNYTNFYSNTDKKFNFQDYPYMKISYRRNVPTSLKTNTGATTTETMMIYAQKDNSPSYKIGRAGTETAVWEQLIVDMREVGVENSIAYYADGAATPTSYGKLVAGGTASTWDKCVIGTDTTPIEIRLTRYGMEERTIDFEYIGFFASEDEAKMYPQALPENATYDVETLTAANKVTAPAGVVTKAQAEAYIEDYLTNFVFATNPNMDKENAVFTAPSSSGAGSYVVNVWFGGSKDEGYIVPVTLTMEQLPEPVIMYTDSTTVMNTFGADNANLKLEDGVVKMTTKKASNDDGFFLLAKLPTSMPNFNATSLPYLKMKYTMSGVSVDANGNPVNSANVAGQFFFWMTDPNNSSIANAQVPCLGFKPYGGSFEDGDTIELIMNVGFVAAGDKGKENGYWVRNITKGETEYTGYKFSSARYEYEKTGYENVKRTDTTRYTQIRFNLARQANLNRSAEVYYAGFFPSLDEAMAFDSDADTTARLNAAADQISGLSAVAPWGDVAKERTEISDEKATLNKDGTVNFAGLKTQTVFATNGLKKWINSMTGAEGPVTINGYTPATTTEKGNITFDIILSSGYQTKEVNNVTINFAEKPDDYIMWRFNDPAILSKVSINSPIKKIENNVLKMEEPSPKNAGNMILEIEVSDFGTEPFHLMDYSYVLMKYKRDGDISPAAYKFTNAEGVTGNISNMGWGWQSGDWYYTLLDTTVRDLYTPWSYNMNLTTGKLVDILATKGYGIPTAAAISGTANKFSFDFGTRNFAKRSAEIEFIAFFPSMADARNYVQNIEKLEDAVSDTTAELKGYTADTVSYYDGNTEAVAEAKAKAIIEDKVSAKGVNVAITKVSYTAPVQDTTDGSYVFTAKVTLDGEDVYTTDEITLTIGNAVDNDTIVYRFTNPEYIKTIAGAKAEYDYKSMKLAGNSFTFEMGADKPNVSEAYAVMALDATYTGSVTALINGTATVTADENGYFDISAVTDAIDTVEFTFEDADAQVVALGFFADDTAADAYSFDAAPAVFATAMAKFSGTHNYALADSKTISDAKTYSYKTYVPDKLSGTGVGFAQLTYDNYVASTTTKGGSIDVTVTLAYGDITATYYTDVTYTANLAIDPYDSDPVTTSKGHHFMGYDTITAQKAFASVPQTLEFSIKVAQGQLSGTMEIVKNGSTIVKLVDGKITIGSLVASAALTADTWTHVAITADGKLYINGELDKTGTAVSFYTDAPVIGQKFAGELYDVRFWSDIRTPAEINTNKATRNDSDGLLANWMLNAASYEYLTLEYKDASANNNTATFKSTGWYKMEAGIQGDYTMFHFGDTQSYFAIDPRDYNRLPEVFEWIADNKDKYNIAHVSLIGDATQNSTVFEWDVIRESFKLIEGKIPYFIPLGNHDYPSPSSGVGAEIRDTTNYRNAFPFDEYLAAYGPEGDNTFGGTFRGEKDLTNMYSLVSAGGVDYVLFSLEYGPRDAVLDWVGEILTKYPERQAVISTHCYFSTDGTLTTSNSTTNREFSDGNEGIDIYEKIVARYPNVLFVTCGHSQGDDSKQHPHNRGDNYKDSPTGNDFGSYAIQILSDISAYAMNYPDASLPYGADGGYGSSKANLVQFGADEGLVFIMAFSNGGKTMHSYVYSPLHDAFFRSVNEQTHEVPEIEVQPSLNVVGTELREAETELPMGMRFKMTLSKSYENFGENNKIEVQGYGMVLVPADAVEEGMEVTEDMFDGTALEELVLVEECSDAMYYNDKNRTDFTVVVHSIPTPETDNGVAYSTEILARAYVDYTVNGGEVQRLYSYKTLTCSMNDLVNAD
ncbi:MAG: hypothetical protein E7588_07970 [Ruminococcaceae bacterium]|nr:hypothetical protein [Oscillospiraceae bacterium]